jgi:hypothetical protein
LTASGLIAYQGSSRGWDRDAQYRDLRPARSRRPAADIQWSTASDADFLVFNETTVADLATQFVPNSRSIEE